MFHWLTRLFRQPARQSQTLAKSFLNDLPEVPLLQEHHQEAIVTMDIFPNQIGQVKHKGHLWNARCCENVTLQVNDRVQVSGRASATLLYVKPIDTTPQATGANPHSNSSTSDIAVIADLNIRSIAPVVPLPRRVHPKAA